MIAATIVDMADGRIALLVEMEPGPSSARPSSTRGDPSALADPKGPGGAGLGVAAPGRQYAAVRAPSVPRSQSGGE